MTPAGEVRTPRLLLRRWRSEDAPELEAALEESVQDLKPWIPWRIAKPAPVPELVTRLNGFAADFDGDIEWLYAILSLDDSRLLGGLSLHPRDAQRRVPSREADRVEIGYWLRTGVTGHGYATEAAQAALQLALALPGMTRVEIRCDPRNAKSAAVPRRLGFRHATTVLRPSSGPDDEGGELMVWEYVIEETEHTKRDYARRAAH